MKRTKGAQLGGMGAGLVLALIVSGCSGEDIAARQTAEAAARQAGAELEKTNTALAATKDELDKTEAATRKTNREWGEVEAENQRLTQKPQNLFDAAVIKMNAGKDNFADQEAMLAFQAVADRFPLDPLAETAAQRIEEIEERIAARDKKLAEDQSEVRKLIETCRNSSKGGRKARDAALRFNAANNIDMNAAMAGERRAATLEKKAKKAKEQATELINSVPDPGGTLKKELQACDQAE
jgi:hypothetical protein